MHEDESVAALWASLRAEQMQLREMLGGAGDTELTTRREGGGWSVLEIVRHLLFAEQAHLGRYDPDRAWSPLGYTPATMREARKLAVGSEREPSMGEVLAEWQAVHERIESALRPLDDQTAEVALLRNLKHLRAHARSIERALRGGVGRR